MTGNLRWIVIVSSFINGLGGFLRWFAGNSYALTFSGQALASIAQGCLLQLPAGTCIPFYEVLTWIISSCCWEMVSRAGEKLGDFDSHFFQLLGLGFWQHWSLLLFQYDLGYRCNKQLSIQLIKQWNVTESLWYTAVPSDVHYDASFCYFGNFLEK